jgi:hypothetical protein
MERMMQVLDLDQTITNWSAISDSVFVPHTERDYDRLEVVILDRLIDQIGRVKTIHWRYDGSCRRIN